MKILVTGGAGFIGSAVIRYLIRETTGGVLSLPIGPNIAGTEVDQVVDGLSRATGAINSENKD